MRAITFVEIDLEVCSLSYGTAPCTATLTGEAPTGTRKCFNTKRTCQDRENYAAAATPLTLRFAKGTADLAASGIEAIGCLDDVSLTPAVISLGKDLGTRASASVRFKDFRWGDSPLGFDPYRTERDYVPFATGTFWGKFRARQPYLRHRALRVIEGSLGQSLDQMETHHFLIESFEGPSLDGAFTITAKDTLKLLSGDRAQAPKPSNGFLLADLTSGATTATLAPSGVGNAEYPASGFVCIAGKESCAFTRSGDTLTLTRGQRGTAAIAHEAQDRVQLCLDYVGKTPAFIINDLMVNYAEVPDTYIPLAEWEAECETFLRRVFSRHLPEPTDVDELVEALIEQAGLAVWDDDAARQMRLQVLRQVPANSEVIDDAVMMAGTLRVREQPKERLSQVWTYFGQRDPTQKADDADNYRSAALTIDADAQADYGSPAYRKIHGSWISAFARVVAQRVNNILLGRFRDAPRRFTFSILRGGRLTPLAGRGYFLASRILQTDTGEPELVPVQVVSVRPSATEYEVEAEEMRFLILDDDDLLNRVLTIDANDFNLNLRQIHDYSYPAPTTGDTVTFVIEAGVVVGSNSTALPAIDLGEWPGFTTPTIILRGRIQGAGGNGGWQQELFGKPGGPALKLAQAATLQFEGGGVWGGGGGGVAYVNGGTVFGGGGGQGAIGGKGGPGSGNGAAGTSEAPGVGFGVAGRGGGPGQAGRPSGSSGFVTGGAAGAAIDGVSHLTISGTADIRGAQIN
ncbi:hypothetical protein [Ancylobacter vacuolatus]|uniref:Phage tail protein n=1 Tax=Ancylobacter vacuolatus TaxID=223389 RepID=A0ABU0DMQ5_9HYPH|nr:hypothetical protein [Ancylobacter vacuolatus]MDQ0349732.1 hypothetical protein [Ancylobacter vacuolatus]